MIELAEDKRKKVVGWFPRFMARHCWKSAAKYWKEANELRDISWEYEQEARKLEERARVWERVIREE